MDDDAADVGQRLSPLMVMPLGIFAAALLCDLGSMVSGRDLFGIAAFYNMAAGLLISFVALLIVLVDLVTASSRPGARERVGTVSAAMTTMTVAFAVVWTLRWEGNRAGTPWLALFEALALAVGVVGAWFAKGVVIGGEMREPVQVWAPAPTPAVTPPPH